jgi:hypothetical protein
MICIAAEVATLLSSLALYGKEELGFTLIKATDLFLQLWSSPNSRRGFSGH